MHKLLIVFLLGRGDGTQHQRMRHLQGRCMWQGIDVIAGQAFE